MQDMLPLFEHYGIQGRIFNSFPEPLFKYPPTKYNHHIPTLNALLKNKLKHIYTATDILQLLLRMVAVRDNQDVCSVKGIPRLMHRQERRTHCI